MLRYIIHFHIHLREKEEMQLVDFSQIIYQLKIFKNSSISIHRHALSNQPGRQQETKVTNQTYQGSHQHSIKSLNVHTCKEAKRNTECIDDTMDDIAHKRKAEVLMEARKKEIRNKNLISCLCFISFYIFCGIGNYYNKNYYTFCTMFIWWILGWTLTSFCILN